MNHVFRQLRKRHQASPGLGPGGGALLVLGFLLLLFTAASSTAMAAGVGVYVYFARDLTPPEAIVGRKISRSTKIYDRNEQLLFEVFDPKGGRRTTVPLSEISPHLIKATIATEDANFYTNVGVNLRGIARAAWITLSGQGGIQGGSSITQQLVKNVLIPERERRQITMTRKVKEVILAYEVTRRYSKDQILEWYLNEIFYGNLSYGVQSAAESYFGKSAKELTLAESAMLAGLPQAPALYMPLTNPVSAKARQKTVLDLMVRQGFITEAEARAAEREELKYGSPTFPVEAPHFVMYVRELLEKRYGAEALYRGGLKVITSLDLELQKHAEALAKEQVQKMADRNVHNAALVSLRPQTGEILAMVGSVDYFDPTIDGQVNMVLAERQPGSAFKPFNYVTALGKGYTPATTLLDVRTSFNDGVNPPYVPENVDRKFRGPVSVRQALATSLNIPAVKTLQFAGLQDVIAMAHRLGLTTLTREKTYGLSLTLGGGEVKLLDMVYAYGVFANNGTMAGAPRSPGEIKTGMRQLDPVVILRVEDADGNLLEEFRAPERQQLLSAELAFLINDILSDNAARAIFFGANSPLQLAGRPAAAKTGTTNDWRDNWTIGYTPDLATGVLVGNANNKPMVESYGSTAAAPIWQKFMEKALQNTPPTPFLRPEGMVEVDVCATSGLLPTPFCPNIRREKFIKGTEPKGFCQVHQPFKIDKTTGLLASSLTPSENIEEKVFTILPPEASDWVREQGIPQPPKDYSYASPADVIIRTPKVGSFVRGVVDIRGSAKGENFVIYSLELGPGLNPTTWTVVGQPQQRPVDNGILGTLDTKGLDGLYTLRLSVVDKIQNVKRVDVPLTIDNEPPTVAIYYPFSNSAVILDKKQSGSVGIQAEARDRYGIDRVEVFVDDQPVGFTTVFPYNVEWHPAAGGHVAYVIAHDKAGNTTQSDVITFRVQFR